MLSDAYRTSSIVVMNELTGDASFQQNTTVTTPKRVT